MQPYHAYIYFNIYMIRSVYFGCGVLELNEIQEKILQSIYEVPLLRKLGLGKKFLYVLIYTRKLASRVELLLLRTIISMLSIKQYIIYSRMKNRAHSLIKANEEWTQMESRYSLHPCHFEVNSHFWKHG